MARRTRLIEAREAADTYRELERGSADPVVRGLYGFAFIAADNAANALDAAAATESGNRGWALRSKARTYLNQARRFAAQALEKTGAA